jgi:hypothetical protein
MARQLTMAVWKGEDLLRGKKEGRKEETGRSSAALNLQGTKHFADCTVNG